MIDDDLLDLAADCYIALRARGYLEAFPTFESFARLVVGFGLSTRHSPPANLRDLAEAPLSEPISDN